jgi:hypothetical protein
MFRTDWHQCLLQIRSTSARSRNCSSSPPTHSVRGTAVSVNQAKLAFDALEMALWIRYRLGR